MSRRRVLKLGLPALLLLGWGGLHAGPALAEKHVARVTGGRELGVVSCTNCHFGGGRRSLPLEDLAYPSPAAMTLSPDGRRLFVSCEGTDEIARIDLDGAGEPQRLPTGRRPHGLASGPDGRVLYAALRAENRVVALDAEDGTELGSVAVGRFPCGLALTPDGDTLLCVNAGSDDLSLVDARSMTERRRLPTGREPYVVTISPDGERAYVANRLAAVHAPGEVPQGELTVVDLPAGRVVERHALDSAHLSEGVAVSADGAHVLVGLSRVRNLLPIAQVRGGWVMNSGLGVLDTRDGSLRQFPLDEINAYFADPSGVAIDAARGRAYVAAGGADCVTVLDLDRLLARAAEVEGEGPGPWADHLGVSAEYVIARVPLGSNPRALRLSPDGSRLYAAEHLGDAVAVIDTESLSVVARHELVDGREPGPARLGEIVFHSADVTFQGQFSCRSCHPDGHSDGLTYDFVIDGMGRSLVDNRSLLALVDTEPFKWNGKNRDLHEQCGPRFAKVLTLSDPFSPEDLDSLVAYIESLASVPRDPPGHAELTASQARGEQVFHRIRDNAGAPIPVAQRCSTCHRPPLYTNLLPSSVGTQAAHDSGDTFDTPHLLGIADTAPYLHDGRAATLEEIWTVHAPDDEHGRVNDLSKLQLNDLVAFLKTL
jgi:DNA-binding beta-propeller fold protein YncE